MQYKVPQSIDMEDKIVGPLTLQQFLYLIFGGLFDYIAYQAFYNSVPGLFWSIFLPVTLVSLAFAFVKVYDRPFSTFIKNAISFAFTPRTRVWHKEEALEVTTTIVNAPVKKELAAPPQRRLEATELEKLSRILDTYSAPTTIPPKTENQKVAHGQNQKSQTG